VDWLWGLLWAISESKRFSSGTEFVPIYYMRKFLHAFVALSLAVTSLPTVAADDTAEAEVEEPKYERNPMAELALMKTVKARVDFYMTQNLASLQQMVFCLTGNLITTECVRRINDVQETIRVKYPEMRRYLILHNMVRPSVTKVIFSGKDKSEIAPRFSPLNKLPNWAMVIDNPLETIFHDIEIATPNITPAEMQDALTSQAVRITAPPTKPGEESVYTNLPENINGYLQLFCELRLKDDLKRVKDCAHIELVFRGYGVELKKFINDGFLVSMAGRSHLDYLGKESWYAEKLVAEQLKGKFYETVRQYPYLALVNSAKPDLEELARVFKIMEKAATAAWGEHNEKWLAREKRGPTFNEYLEIMDYGPVVAHVIEAYENGFRTAEMTAAYEPDYNAVATPLFTQRAKGQLLEAGGHLVKMLGYNVAACWFPGSKYLKGYRIAKAGVRLKSARLATAGLRLHHFQKFFVNIVRPICYSLVNVGFSIYFVNGSINYYQKTYNEIFSVMAGDVGEDRRDANGERDGLDTGERYLQEVSNLSTAETILLIDLLTAPMGTGALANAIKRTTLPISNGFKQHLLDLVLAR
jgi:hypothetical protein